MGSLLATNADWVRIAEAAYRATGTDAEWANGVLDAIRGVVNAPAISFMSVAFLQGSDPPRLRFYVGEPYGDLALHSLPEMAKVERSVIDMFFFPPSIVNTHSSLEPSMSPGARRLLASYRARAGIVDALGAVVNPVAGESTVIFTGSKALIAPSRAEVDRLTRAALHIEAGLRVRRRPESIQAVIDPTGKLLHHEPHAPARELLVAQTRLIERARTRRSRRSPNALELWTALVDGRTSLVERFDGGKRYYLVLENRPERQPMRALSRGELDVVADAARGLTAKLIAYGHGISAARVSSRLASATAKLGLASRMELVRIAALLCHPTRPPISRAKLTAAENDVLGLLIAGLSNAEIARRRNRSVRTIANQVARLLAKTGSSTRRTLVARA